MLGDDIHNLNSGNVLISPGNLGIGTNVPNARLHVQGDALFNFPGPRQLRVHTPLKSIGFIANDQNGDRRDLAFDSQGISLLTSPDSTSPHVENGLKIGETGTVRIGSSNGITLSLVPDDGGQGGAIRMRDSAANQTVVFQAEHQHEGGRILLINPNRPGALIQIDSNWEDTGDSRVVSNVIEITGGSDLSENFDIAGDIEPGLVVSIDRAHEGRLAVSDRAYDRRVAGIVSGANDIKPGMLMGQRGSVADGDYPVALSGRVYCRADTSRGEIEPGDLITSSDTPGHCMRARNYKKGRGAILGKALSGIGDGFVLVLVDLQ